MSEERECREARRVATERYDRLVAALRELADDLWRVAPCGCGHRADLHTIGVFGPSVCSGGLGLCECRWSFSRIVQERVRALLAEHGEATP